MKKLGFFLSAILIKSSLLMGQPYYTPNAPVDQARNYPASSMGYQSAPSSNIQWLRNYSEAVSLSQSTSKPIAILFTGTAWCPACMKLERAVLTHPEFIQRVANRFVFLKAEFPDYSESAVNASPYKSLLDRYGVTAFPTIVVVNANGQQLFTVNYREGGPHVYAQELLNKLGPNY